jgi:hypothetical protein
MPDVNDDYNVPGPDFLSSEAPVAPDTEDPAVVDALNKLRDKLHTGARSKKAAPPPMPPPDEALRSLAEHVYAMYTEFRLAGFSDDQAFRMASRYLVSMMTVSARGES